MRTALFPVIALMSLTVLGACQKREVNVEGGWVRLSAAPDTPSAAYFTIKGGSDATRLSSVSSPVVIRSEMHESVSEGGMTKMNKLDGIDVPAGATLKFEPGGKHVMLWNVNPGIKPGGRMQMIFTFADGTQLEYPMAVQGPAGPAAPAGTPAPAQGEAAGNHSG